MACGLQSATTDPHSRGVKLKRRRQLMRNQTLEERNVRTIWGYFVTATMTEIMALTKNDRAYLAAQIRASRRHRLHSGLRQGAGE